MAMAKTVNYEWDVETVAVVETEAHDVGDVLDHDFAGDFAEALTLARRDPGPGLAYQVALVRDDGTRSWAYVQYTRPDSPKRPQLPADFIDTYGNPWAAVPQRFHDEVRHLPAGAIVHVAGMSGRQRRSLTRWRGGCAGR
jgi:hypothetical protein